MRYFYHFHPRKCQLSHKGLLGLIENKKNLVRKKDNRKKVSGRWRLILTFFMSACVRDSRNQKSVLQALHTRKKNLAYCRRLHTVNRKWFNSKKMRPTFQYIRLRKFIWLRYENGAFIRTTAMKIFTETSEISDVKKLEK